jgi:hypothetical protein
MEKENLKYINKGVSQTERLPSSLLPEHIKIDDRTTVDLISFLGSYASLLNYYKVDQRTGGRIAKDGDWSFFIKDPVFYLAEIATTNSIAKDNDINLVLTTFQKNTSSFSDKIYALRLLFSVITETLTLINRWLGYLDELPEDFSSNLIKIVQDNLSPKLSLTRGCALFYQKHAKLSTYIYFDPAVLKSFDTRYWLNLKNYYPIEKQENALIKSCEKFEDPAVIIQHTYTEIASIAHDIVYNCNHIINLAKKGFNKIIQGDGNMKPDLALLVGFLELFETAQTKMNGLTKEHLDFYYRDILKLKETPIVPDKTVLLMKLTEGCDEVVIPTGTAFDAGKDASGNTIIFRALQTTGLNQVQIADLRTLFSASNPLLQPPLPVTTAPLITGIYTALQPFPIPAAPIGFPVLGEDQLMYSAEQQTMQQTNIGFACSSLVLFLSSGERTITVKLNFTEISFHTNFIRQLETIAAADQTVNGKKPDNADAKALFDKLFSTAFVASATGLKGWFPLNISGISYDESDCSISIMLAMSASEQAVTGYNTAVHGPSYTTPYPILSLVLQHNFPYYCYNFLNNLEIKNVVIDTKVNGFNNIVLYNQYGQIDYSKPFAPLGVQPDRGAYLLIGSKEMFIKKLSEIDIAIDWQTIPPTGNFADYYTGYDTTPAITNDSFRLAASIRNNNTWVVPDGLQNNFNLYQDRATAKNSLNGSSTFLLVKLGDDIQCATIDPASMELPLKIDQNTPGGYIKFELSNPAFGFGAGIYSNVLSTTILKNSQAQMEQYPQGILKLIEGTKEIVTKPSLSPLPNQPYTPVAQAIRINYSATDTIDLMPGAKAIPGYNPFYHLDVFNIHSVTTREAKKDKGVENSIHTNKEKIATIKPGNRLGSYKFLLPHYVNEGNLYIGLENVSAPVPFNIFFQLSEKALDATMPKLTGVTWSYLSDDQWKNFVEDSTIDDDTAGLTRSGIVRFNIPSGVTGKNSIMPGKLFWLRVQATDQLTIFSNLAIISTQAIEVDYSNADATERTSFVLPAASITKPISVIPGLKSVVQPTASVGGIAVETRNKFYTRVSERLRHKQRAILSWDYERLALEQFPEIYKAKCIASSNLKTKYVSVKTGVTELVVIPRVNVSGVNENISVGPVFGFTMLEEIKKYLQRYTSVHARITVRNPVYEQLTIKCQVKFTDNDAFQIKNLNEDISNFLSPWRTGNHIAYDIGEGLQKSTVLAFIQQLSYVEFVTAFSVIKIAEIDDRYHFYDSAATKTEDPGKGVNEQDDVLYALTPYSVFVSASQHVISVIDKIVYSKAEALGVGDLSIDKDFIITSDAVKEKKPVSTNNFYLI